MDQFLRHIYRWYDENKRDLPWRRTKDPYKIWISEIILQQTRVIQGTPYYSNFITRFPTVRDLAGAEEDEILKLWQGLGYYARAQNLHFSARYIVGELKGKFPNTYEKILNLKGVGPYTAAAVASLAFDLPCPVLDGNIYRLLSRYYGIPESPSSPQGKKIFSQRAIELIPEKNPGFHNQALMEFGALQCVPHSPGCINCPVQSSCFACKKDMVSEFPARTVKRKLRKRYFYFFFLANGAYTWLEKRTGTDIWKNLYQLPLMETPEELSETEILKLKNIPFLDQCAGNIKKISPSRKHILSHQVIYARLIHLEVDNHCCPQNVLFRIKKNNISTFAVPRLVEILLQENGYL